VENTVLETTSLVAKAVVESLWDYAVAKMKVLDERKKLEEHSEKKKTEGPL
jgi:hypothetical protein